MKISVQTLLYIHYPRAKWRIKLFFVPAIKKIPKGFFLLREIFIFHLIIYRINITKTLINRAYDISSTYIKLNIDDEFLLAFFQNNGHPLKFFINSCCAVVLQGEPVSFVDNFVLLGRAIRSLA